MVRAYAQAYLLKRRTMNEELWLEGVYMAHAFQTTLARAFGKHNAKYLDKPLDIFEKTQAEKNDEIRNERKKAIEALNKFKRIFKQSADTKQGVDKDGKP